MTRLLFTMEGRIARGQYWKAVIIYVVVGAVVSGLVPLLWGVMPGTVSADGTYSVSGVTALPYIALSLGYIVLSIWSGICVNAKRCHDRNKSGWFMLIQFIPLIGAIWYLIEAGFLRGTIGPNRFGPDPLGAHGLAPMTTNSALGSSF